jgi:hypothetical protein
MRALGEFSLRSADTDSYCREGARNALQLRSRGNTTQA